MSLFGRNDQAVTANSTTTAESTTGAPLGTYAQVKGGKTGTVTPAGGANSAYGNTSAGSAANVDSLMYQNVTLNKFVNNQAVGIFGVSATEMANASNSSSHDRPSHAGWVLRRAGTGPVTGATVGNNGANFANGETLTISNATSNGILTVTTNATGNMVTLTVTSGGVGFLNASMIAVAFNRELHVANITGTGATLSYNNADIITVSNAAGMITNAVWHIATNATGGIVNSGMVASNAINVGLFANSQTNAGLVFTVTNSTGGTAAGNSTTTGLASVLITSTNGNVSSYVLGGRAGRVHTETLVAMGSLGAQSAAYGTPATANDTSGDDTYYPGL